MTEKIKNEIRDRKNIFWSLTVGIALSLGLYVYFVGHTVYTVVERQKAEASIAALESSAEKLETNYLSLKARITVDLARSKGFQELSSSARYISRNLPAKVLTLNNEI